MQKKIEKPAYEELRDTLRQEIINGIIPNDTRLTISELAEKYNISHMPVREALRSLHGEGLVEMIPRRGARVKAFDVKTVGDIYDIMGALEGIIAKIAVYKISDYQINEFEKLVAEHEKGVMEKDISASSLANKKLHLFLYEIADNGPAIEIYNQYDDILRSLRMNYGFGYERLLETVSEHKKIVELLRKKDIAALTDMMVEHNEKAKLDVVARMRQGLRA